MLEHIDRLTYALWLLFLYRRKRTSGAEEFLTTLHCYCANLGQSTKGGLKVPYMPRTVVSLRTTILVGGIRK